jgi:hypothetical protein
MYLTPPELGDLTRFDNPRQQLNYLARERLKRFDPRIGRHVLMWGIFQPPGRPYYDFENHRWGVFPD